MIFLFIVLLLFSGFSEGIMDKLQFHYHKSIFIYFKNQSFWDPTISWRNKWKNGDPDKGPSFFGSSSIFVSLTDAWHLFKLVRNIFLFVGLSFLSYQSKNIYHLFIYIIIARIVYGIGFWISYNRILVK